MKLLNQLSVITLVITLATSCSTQNGFIQKRKYSKGYHVSLKKNNKLQKQEVQPIEAIETSEMATIFIEKADLPTKNTDTQIKTEKTTNSIAYIEDNNEKSTKKNISLKEITTKQVNRPLFSEKTLKNKSLKFKSTSNNLSETKETTGVNTLLLYVLCFFIPPLAVGLATDWEVGKVLLNLLLTLLFFVPGLIHALIIVSRNT